MQDSIKKKVKEDGDLPRILLDLLGIRKEKLVSKCSNVVAMEEDLGLATSYNIQDTEYEDEETYCI